MNFLKTGKNVLRKCVVIVGIVEVIDTFWR